MESSLINRVASSGIMTLNLEDFFPDKDRMIFDIQPYLFHGLILKEKDFRSALKELDWTTFEDKIVLIQCSSDAIIPMWAYMLISQYLEGVAYEVFVGTDAEYIKSWYHKALKENDWSSYHDCRVVVKGCGEKPVPPEAYSMITFLLKPFAKSIMFGEPCSTVPIYKKS
ncbi:MAG: DUF2480 family protein [Saprospiraceae bacterium]|nr:DUF2480 family protein [Saprospiraceae bacterium]